MRLTTQPASDVTVSVSRAAGSSAIGFDADGDGTFETTGTETLTFTNGNWRTTQAVKVRAPADVPADTTAALSHNASGADCGSVAASLTVNVRDNRPPVANAGPRQEAYSGQTITLDGSNSSDPDDAVSTLSYSWRQSAGTPEVSLGGANTAPAQLCRAYLAHRGRGFGVRAHRNRPFSQLGHRYCQGQAAGGAAE